MFDRGRLGHRETQQCLYQLVALLENADTMESRKRLFASRLRRRTTVREHWQHKRQETISDEFWLRSIYLLLAQG